jgi:hypothetical protein
MYATAAQSCQLLSAMVHSMHTQHACAGRSHIAAAASSASLALPATLPPPPSLPPSLPPPFPAPGIKQCGQSERATSAPPAPPQPRAALLSGAPVGTQPGRAASGPGACNLARRPLGTQDTVHLQRRGPRGCRVGGRRPPHARPLASRCNSRRRTMLTRRRPSRSAAAASTACSGTSHPPARLPAPACARGNFGRRGREGGLTKRVCVARRPTMSTCMPQPAHVGLRQVEHWTLRHIVERDVVGAGSTITAGRCRSCVSKRQHWKGLRSVYEGGVCCPNMDAQARACYRAGCAGHGQNSPAP